MKNLKSNVNIVVNSKPEIELSNNIDYTDNSSHNDDQIQNKTTQESDDVS